MNNLNIRKIDKFIKASKNNQKAKRAKDVAAP